MSDSAQSKFWSTLKPKCAVRIKEEEGERGERERGRKGALEDEEEKHTISKCLGI